VNIFTEKMDSIPVEITDYILRFITEPCMRIVCKFVCHEWNDVLSTNIVENYKNLCGDAVGRKYFNVLEWLRANGCPWDVNVVKYLAMRGDLQMLKKVKEQGCAIGAEVCDYAAGWNNFNVLEWAIAKGLHPTERVFYYVAKNGHINMLNWLCSRMYYIHRSAKRGSIMSKNPEVVKWMIHKGMVYNIDNMNFAIRQGCLDICIELANYGVGFDSFSCVYATFGGHLHILEYLYTHHKCHKLLLPNIYLIAIEKKYTHIIKWLENIGFCYNPEIHHEISKQNFYAIVGPVYS